MEIVNASTHRAAVVTLLFSEKLPVDDLPERLENFLAAIDNGQLIGAAGIEIYGAFGLLRSVVVQPTYRGSGIAGKLITELERLSAAKGLTALILLTETAPGYFEKNGFSKINRDDVPEAVRASSEFRHVCPVSAVVMKKSIT
jgi:amino-acid N-acetyltransferase